MSFLTNIYFNEFCAHPRKLTWNLKLPPCEKEKRLHTTKLLGSMLVFRGAQTPNIAKLYHRGSWMFEIPSFQKPPEGFKDLAPTGGHSNLVVEAPPSDKFVNPIGSFSPKHGSKHDKKHTPPWKNIWTISRLTVASVFGILGALVSMEVTAFGKSKQKLENTKPNGMATNPTRWLKHVPWRSILPLILGNLILVHINVSGEISKKPSSRWFLDSPFEPKTFDTQRKKGQWHGPRNVISKIETFGHFFCGSRN